MCPCAFSWISISLLRWMICFSPLWWSRFCLKWTKYRIVRSDTEVPRPWSSPLISLKVAVSLVTSHIVYFFFSISIFLSWSLPGMLTVLKTFNFYFSATVLKGTSSWLYSLYLQHACFIFFFFLISWDSSLSFAFCGLCAVAPSKRHSGDFSRCLKYTNCINGNVLPAYSKE